MGDLHKKGSSITSAFYQHPQATETYSKASQTSEMVLSIKAVQVFPPLTILAKISIVDIWFWNGLSLARKGTKDDKSKKLCGFIIF